MFVHFPLLAIWQIGGWTGTGEGLIGTLNTEVRCRWPPEPPPIFRFLAIKQIQRIRFLVPTALDGKNGRRKPFHTPSLL